MLCAKCGAKMEITDSFCPFCGAPRREMPKLDVRESLDVKISAEEITREDIHRAKMLYNIETPTAPPTKIVPVKEKKHFPIKIVGLVSIILLIAGFLGYLSLFTNFFVSDEKLIRNRLNVFIEGVNEGDIEKIESCFDKSKRDASGELSPEGRALLEGLLEFGDLSTNVEKINGISVNEDTAEVTVDVKVRVTSFLEKIMTVKITLAETKEGPFTRDWYIVNIETVQEDVPQEKEGVEL